jgi:hypothetical protein
MLIFQIPDITDLCLSFSLKWQEGGEEERERIYLDAIKLCKRKARKQEGRIQNDD